jgi:hypothetical protein
VTLEKAIDRAAEVLPDGWRLRIDVERGAATVSIIRPDGSEVFCSDDGESCLTMQACSMTRVPFEEAACAAQQAKEGGGK